jgi:hypothetical protein
VHRSSLLDHLVSGGQQRFRDGQAERLGGLEVDDEFEFGRPNDRQLGRFRAPLSSSHRGFHRGQGFSPRVSGALPAALDAWEPRIGAFVTLNLPAARAAADRLTARWRAGNLLSPIDGMPLGIKDITR